MKAPENIRQLMEQFADLLLAPSSQMEIDQELKDEKLRQGMANDLSTVKQEQWPLLKLSKLLCQWLQKLEKKLSGLDE